MFTEKNLICIDPGLNGGICTYIDGKIESHKMPETPQDIYDLLSNFNSLGTRCFLEKVHGMPGQGGAAMFTFGKGYGWIEMALLVLNIPTETLSPQKWQKPLSLGTSGSCASKTEWKNKLKAKAQQLFPGHKITLWNADAFLILHFAVNV